MGPLLELFSGLGAAGLAWGGPVAGAIDQSAAANQAYTLNHGLVPHPWNLAAVREPQLAAFAAPRWWLSPPCQPHTVRGPARDLDDPRASALLQVLPLIARLRPPVVAMENVPGFVPSAARGRLRATLLGAGYTLLERLACPSALGVPMRRLRYYLVAYLDAGTPSRSDFSTPVMAAPLRALASYLDGAEGAEGAGGAGGVAPGYLSEATVRGFGHSAHVVDAANPEAVANCFTSAYGRSPVRAGSYLRDQHGVRRFSPEEGLRLLGFPATFRFPAAMPTSTRWELAGNSLAIPAVRAVLDEAAVGVGRCVR